MQTPPFAVALACAFFLSTSADARSRHQLQGMASYYSKGQRTASGDRFNRNGFTAAHRTLPFGTLVRVVNRRNGRSVSVRINDRGPFRRGRVIDVSRAAASKLGMIRSGVVPVRLEVGLTAKELRRAFAKLNRLAIVRKEVHRPVETSRLVGTPETTRPAGASTSDDEVTARMREVIQQMIRHEDAASVAMVEAYPPQARSLFADFPVLSLVKSFWDELSRARDHLIKTATIGGTMARQGPSVAIGRLHPVLIKRLSAAVAEARASGLPNAGCYSPYRPPGLGVGGFRDKFMSMHAYGLACDMHGVGRPNSREAKRWHEIATRHRLYNPYFRTRKWWEWNHYQVTMAKVIPKGHPLRRTITAKGPIDNERMWKVAETLIDKGAPKTERRKKRRSRFAHRRQHRG